MTEDDALARLMLATASSEDGACPELVALRRLGWRTSMVLDKDGATIEIKRPKGKRERVL